MEKFKESQKSICHRCFNVQYNCSLVDKWCETDRKIGMAYVKSCSKFNKSINSVKVETNYVTVDVKQDSRVEMMGGGYADHGQTYEEIKLERGE